MANFIQLKNTPIKEIIFTVSFNENVDIECLGKFVKLPQVFERFVNVSKGYQTDIQEDNGSMPEATISNDGYILSTGTTGNRILQARRGSFSFHKVKEYEKFDVLLNEFKEYWLALEGCTGELSISNISVRYLNFIEQKANEKEEDLITVHLKHPFSANVDKFIHLKFNHPDNNAVLVDIISAKGKESSQDGIILDIILNRTLKGEKNTDIIFKLISELRSVKNELFYKCITEKTIEKYNS